MSPPLLQGFLEHVGVPQGTRLTGTEWGLLRASLGRPRRFSLTFLRQVCQPHLTIIPDVMKSLMTPCAQQACPIINVTFHGCSCHRLPASEDQCGTPSH